MKKRTLLAASLLAASISQAGAKDSVDYIAEHTGGMQTQANELCLKVDTQMIASMGPKGQMTGHIVGLRVASEVSASDLVIAPDRATGICETGYIKFITTANLMSVRNAPVGL